MVTILLPAGRAHHGVQDWSDSARNWRQGAAITANAPEDEDSENGSAVIHRFAYPVSALEQGNPPDWAALPRGYLLRRGRTGHNPSTGCRSDVPADLRPGQSHGK